MLWNLFFNFLKAQTCIIIVLVLTLLIFVALLLGITYVVARLCIFFECFCLRYRLIGLYFRKKGLPAIDSCKEGPKHSKIRGKTMDIISIKGKKDLVENKEKQKEREREKKERSI